MIFSYYNAFMRSTIALTIFSTLLKPGSVVLVNYYLLFLCFTHNSHSCNATSFAPHLRCVVPPVTEVDTSSRHVSSEPENGIQVQNLAK